MKKSHSLTARNYIIWLLSFMLIFSLLISNHSFSRDTLAANDVAVDIIHDYSDSGPHPTLSTLFPIGDLDLKTLYQTNNDGKKYMVTKVTVEYWSLNSPTPTGPSIAVYEGNDLDDPQFDFELGYAYVINICYEPSTTLHVYKSWDGLQKVAAVYNPNGGTGDTYAEILTIGISHTVLDNLTDPGYTRVYYDFVGWNTEPDDSGTSYQPGDIISMNNSITLYAQWKPLATIIVKHIDRSDPSITLDEEEYRVSPGAYGPYPDKVIAGYRLANWDPTSAPVSGTINYGDTITIVYLYESALKDLEITVKWEDFNNISNTRPANITVGIFRNGVPLQIKTVAAVTNANEQTVIFEDLERFDSMGNEYVFTVSQTPVSGYSTTVNDLIITNTLTTVSVTYDPNGGTGGRVDSGVITNSSYVIRTLSDAGVTPPLGSIFTGWNTRPDGAGITYFPGQSVTLTDNMLFYAIWVRLN